MSRWIERLLGQGLAGLLVLAAGCPCQALAQESLFDRLQLTALGVGFGRVEPVNVLPTDAYSVQADYGEIVKNVRVVFQATYWDSRFEDGVVDDLVARLRSTIIDPARDDTLRAGRITVSDVALEGDFRWTPFGPKFLRPYLGLGFGAHVVNAESPFISETIIESTLDNIAAGFAGVTGLDLVVGRLSVGVEGRYNVLSTVRYGSARAIARYAFRGPSGRGR